MDTCVCWEKKTYMLFQVLCKMSIEFIIMRAPRRELIIYLGSKFKGHDKLVEEMVLNET